MTIATPPQLSALIVDDDRGTRMLLAAELSAAGYRVVEAASGDEALRALAAHRFRLVLTDWIMPGLDGLELCRHVRANPDLRGTYIIMITVNSDKPRLIDAFAAGVDDFLPKPVEPGILMARMRAAARTLELQQALLARNAELEAANRRLVQLASTDELTGLPNRRSGLIRLAEHWTLSRAQGSPLAVAILDIDHFKRFNDTYGHVIGDRLLADIAAVLTRGCRQGDTVCRYGGEEFLCVLPDTDQAGGQEMAERLRHAVGSYLCAEGALSLAVTASVGVAMLTDRHGTATDLIRAADDALYAAKEAGRNAVRLAA